MADYGAQQGREYGRPANYGHTSDYQRDAAFNNIFGARPADRSQTMTSQSFRPPPDRAATMSSQVSDVMQRMPPMRPGTNGYGSPQPNGYMPPRGASDGAMPPRGQPHNQYLPQPLRPDRRPYNMPQRMDPRGVPPPQPYGNKPLPQRYPAGPPGPALNSDAYRSQSLASGPRPQMYPPGYNNMNPAHNFRQAPYANQARTTAQGRVVPERSDERTMSLSSFNRDHEHAQTMSGRVIPNRPKQEVNGGPPERTPSGGYPGQPFVPQPGTKTRSPSQGSFSTQRTMSMASTICPPMELGEHSLMPTKSGSGKQGAARERPLVYPALLSRVAEVFRERIILGEKDKDGLMYQSAFTGAESVELIAYIIRTSDRNLALLLGRSLDAQKFFHEVTYAHRLRDSQAEVYQFRETLMEDSTEVNGVFTLLTECYSPTCTRDKLCYSIACPRRLEQQARLNLKPQPGLRKQESKASLHDDDDDEKKLWIMTVSKEVADSITDKEKKRQEVISELMYTERDFVKDLEYLRDFWMKPLRNPATSPIPEHRREKFIRTVFSNCQEVYKVNARMAESLTRRQQVGPVVSNVGDVFLEYVPHFAPFIKYGANQLFGKYEFEHEKKTNPAFAKFVEEVERMKESRKLELNGYLTKPTTRLARYPLLLENVLKYTADENPDKTDIPKAIVIIKDTLSKVNVESGKAENHFNLVQLNRDLKFRPGEYVDLKLTEENRQLIFKGSLKKSPTENTSDIQAYLFDHAVLLVRMKTVNKKEEMKVYKKPIPLELLVITQMEEVLPKSGMTRRPSTSLSLGANKNTVNAGAKAENKQQGYPITFKHLGKGGYEQTLYASTQISQEKWMKHIQTQQKTLRDRSNIFTKEIVCEGFFNQSIKVNCCVPLGQYFVFCSPSFLLTCTQTVAANWPMVLTLEFTLLTADQGTPPSSPDGF